MIRTKEQFKQDRGQIWCDDVLDTVVDLESRLKAAESVTLGVIDMLDKHNRGRGPTTKENVVVTVDNVLAADMRATIRFQDTINDLERKLKAATEMGPCGRHPKSFTKPACNHAVDCPCSPYCTICYEFDRAYKEIERLQTEAVEKSDCGHPKMFWEEAEETCLCGFKLRQHQNYVNDKKQPSTCTHFRTAWPAMKIESKCTLCAEVQAACKVHEDKWRQYEREYILPLFKMATDHGFDLQQLVVNNPDKNCVLLYVEKVEKAAYKRGKRDAANEYQRVLREEGVQMRICELAWNEILFLKDQGEK